MAADLSSLHLLDDTVFGHFERFRKLETKRGLVPTNTLDPLARDILRLLYYEWSSIPLQMSYIVLLDHRFLMQSPWTTPLYN